MTPGPLWESFRERVIYGFHGNLQSPIDRARQQEYRREDLAGDWLGSGYYFWLDAPRRAWDWADEVAERAAKAHPEKAAEVPGVVLAQLQFNDSWIDLLEQTPWFENFRIVALNLMVSGLLPNQPGVLTASVLHRRDFAIIEKAMNDARLNGVAVDAIRGAFIDGDTVMEQSAHYSQSHVQIAVRNPNVILATESISR